MESNIRPFLVGEVVYNTEDIYLYETAGYGGKTMLLNKDSSSIVKKYHHNKEMYMALGDYNKYYDAAWTNKFNKFTTTKPIKETINYDNNLDIEDINTNNIENKETNNNNETEDNNKEETISDIIKMEDGRENVLIWLLDKIIKFISRIFKKKK